ncbi:MAG: hypothetical protein KDK71_09115 [Chlamydiia bacterium]|nr:hypothetical protein [Chlamydiia bacterium]
METISPTRSYFVRIGETPVGFIEADNGITPIPYHPSLFENTTWSTDLTRLVKGYEDDARKIEKRYPQGMGEVVDVNFSDLGLTHLPPQVLLQCTKARTLDISGNRIHWLPIQLSELRLVKLNISRNLRLQPNFDSCAWLLGMPGLKIIADDMGFTFIPREWRGTDRFSTNQLPPGYLEMDCQTQENY